jgi:thiol-disulfide isomerase/thioredoxin
MYFRYALRFVLASIVVPSLQPYASAQERADGATSVALPRIEFKLAQDAVPLTLTGDTVNAELAEKKPSGVTNEPAYRGKPRYSVIRIGDGPKSEYILAVDEPDSKDFKLYIDANRNGDLSDDSDGSYDSKSKDTKSRFEKDPEITTIYTKRLTLRVSRGSATNEVASGPYGIVVERVIRNNPARPTVFRSLLRVCGLTGGTGSIELGGKRHRAILQTESIGQVYPELLRSGMGPWQKISREEAAFRQLGFLLVDLDDNGEFGNDPDREESFQIAEPFQMAGSNYEAEYASDATSLVLSTTTKLASNVLLPVGASAPDFAANTVDGRKLKLSDYIGKVVILDFWATWCGPCVKGLPHIESIRQAAQDRGVVVLAVAVGETRRNVEEFLAKNQDKFHFSFFLDQDDNNGGRSHYHVGAMPTTYVLGRDGKVAAAFTGYDDGDRRLDAALKALGVTVTKDDKSR